MALHPSHAMSTASVPGPDSIAATLDFAPIAASAPTLHYVTAARPYLTAWLLHHLYGLLCEAVFFWIPLDIFWWLFADGAFVALQFWLLMGVHFCTMGMHFCSTMWALLGGRRNAVDNLIQLFLFANVVTVALSAVGKCLIAVKTKLDTFDEVALLRALVLALVTIMLWPMLFGSSGRSTAPTPPPGPNHERGHVLGPRPKYNKHAANDLHVSSDPDGEGDEYKPPVPAPRPTPDASRRARSMRLSFRPSSRSSRYRHRERRVRARTVLPHPRADFVCSRFARFLFPSAPTKLTPHQSLAPDDEIVYAMGVTDGGSGLKKAKAWPPVNDKNASYFISMRAPAAPRRAPAPDDHNECFVEMMATGDDETFNHKLHFNPTFSGECGVAFSIFQRAFSVTLSAIQETGDEYDLNETRMGNDAGGDAQMARSAATGTPALPYPQEALVKRNRRNKLLYSRISTRTCRTRTSATTSSRHSTAMATPLGCGLFCSAMCPSPTSRWPLSKPTGST